MLINAYNAGMGNMKNILSGFVENCDLNYVKKKSSNTTELGVFYALTQYGKNKENSYKNDASNYVFRVLGSAKSLSNTDTDTDLKFSDIDFTENIPAQKIARENESSWLPEKIGGTLGAIGGIAWMMRGKISDAVIQRQRNKKMEISSAVVPENTKMNRRKFLEWGASTTAALAIGATALTQCESENSSGKKVQKKKSETDSLSNTPDWGLTLREKSKSSPYKYNSQMEKSLIQKFSQDKKQYGDFLHPQDKNYRKLEIGNRIYGNVITPWIQKFSEEFHLKNYDTEQSIVEDIKNRHLVSLPEMDSPYYRIRSAGNRKLRHKYGKKVTAESNHPDYMAVTPKTKKLLEEISQNVNTEFRKQYKQANGSEFPENFTIRLLINSLTRDHEYQQKYLHNSSKNSSHTNGTGFDIGFNFDLVDTDKGEFFRFSKTDKNSDLRRFNQRVTACLTHVLHEMQHEIKNGKIITPYKGKLFAIDEAGASHYHISGREGETDWSPSPSNIIKLKKGQIRKTYGL